MNRPAGSRQSGPWWAWAAILALVVIGGCAGDSGPTATANKTPDKAGRVTGRVFDLSNGQDIAGAFVSLESGRGSIQTLSGADGGYLFSAVDAGSYRLSVDAGGFKGNFQNVLLGARVALAVDVGLRPSTTKGDVTGFVVDATTGARIGSAVLSIAAKNRTTFTDSGGRFVFDRLDAGSLTVVVQAVGHAPFSAIIAVPAGGVNLETFRLNPDAGSIAGLVLSTAPTRAAAPLAGVAVKLLRVAPSFAGRTVTFTPLATNPVGSVETGIVTRTGADGRYRLDNVTQGLAGLLFEAGSHDPILTTTNVLLGRTTTKNVSMRFNRASLSGKVSDLSGFPVAGALVSVPEDGITTFTNAAGNYDLSGRIIVRNFPRTVLIFGVPVFLPAHQTAVGAVAAGFRQNSALVNFVPGTMSRLDFVLSRATGNLIGRIVRARGGTPVGGAVVSLPQLGLTTGATGTGDFAFANLPSAFLQVNIVSTGFLPVTTFAAILPNQTTVTQVRLSAPGSLTGTVRTLATRSPVVGARVAIATLARQSLTDNSGVYNLNDLPPGTFQVDVTSATETPATTIATIVDGTVTTKDVTMRP